MELFGQILVVVIIAVILTVWVKYPAWRGRQRTNAMRSVAAREGWEFTAGRTAPPVGPLTTSIIFNRGISHAMSDSIYGHIELRERRIPFTMGDFVYWFQAGGKFKMTASETFSYLLLQLPFAEVPNLVIRRERPQDRLSATMSSDDINFESYAFSSKYHVKCADKRYAYDLLHPQMIEFFLQSIPPGVDIQNGWLCVSDGRETWPHEVFADRVQRAVQFLQHWPRHLASLTEAGVVD